MFLRKDHFLFLLTALALGITTCFALWSCGPEPPLKIGFVGGLTGRVADLGVAGRDGFIYAIEEKNQAGGIAGRLLEMVIRDDQQTPDGARKAVRSLLNEEVLAIVGPMTSSMGVVVKPLVDAGKTTMISPTVKTDQLSGQDDFFFRVTSPLSRNAQYVAAYATRQRALKKFAVIYDASNKAFTETWLTHFRAALQEKAGEVVVVEEFQSSPDVHFLPIAERVLSKQPDGLLLLSNAIDTAMISQQMRKLGSDVPIFSSEWAFTTDLISFGGRAVNGMTSFHSFNANEAGHIYLQFKKGFIERFGYPPSFATVLAYDATTFLFHGLEKTTERSELKHALLEVGAFAGLQSHIKVDKYGDVERSLFLTVVDNGEFKVLE
jgi:branched-chain amino acid transport system substrate-binding protein